MAVQKQVYAPLPAASVVMWSQADRAGCYQLVFTGQSPAIGGLRVITVRPRDGAAYSFSVAPDGSRALALAGDPGNGFFYDAGAGAQYATLGGLFVRLHLGDGDFVECDNAYARFEYLGESGVSVVPFLA